VSGDAACDARSLRLGDGLEVLISSKLETLSPGEILEVASDDASIEHDLRAWSRLMAHEWRGVRVEKGRVICSIERGSAQRIIAKRLPIEAVTNIPAIADPRTGFSPRGAIVESGSPGFPFDVNPLVEESLIVLAAGGLQPERLPGGVRAVRRLYETMHENRIKRLQQIGFSSEDSEHVSQSHTPNFM